MIRWNVAVEYTPHYKHGQLWYWEVMRDDGSYYVLTAGRSSSILEVGEDIADALDSDRLALHDPTR